MDLLAGKQLLYNQTRRLFIHLWSSAARYDARNLYLFPFDFSYSLRISMLHMLMIIVKFFLICSSIISLIFLVRLILHRTALIYVARKWADWIDDRVHIHQHFKIPEMNDSTLQENQLYRRVSLYLDSMSSLQDSDFINLVSGRKHNDIVLSPDNDQVVVDNFLGARVSWVNRIDRGEKNQIVSRSFVMVIKKKDKRRILKPYLQHIHTVSDDIEQRGKDLRIFNNGSNGKWTSVPFNHPATFDSLVIDTDLKAKIQTELEAFIRSEQYYHKLGRIWKRSYLLYGPSGTGKSSFIAAIANFLNFDIYNLNLSQVAADADLNKLLLQSDRKSLIAVEDLDRYVSEKSRMRVSLSALLNFMDGISNFHDERIMVFTMSSKDGVDSSLLRPGRIDVHIYFPMCDFNSFKNLASNYLGVKEHKLFPQVEEIIQSGKTMSPAEISELMLVNRSSPTRALKRLIAALESSGRKSRRDAPLLMDSASSSPVPHSTAEDSDSTHWKETLPDEFRKLYGLLKAKSSKKLTTVDFDNEIVDR